MSTKDNISVEKIIVSIVIISILLYLILYSSSININYSDIKDYISMLQNTSAMIFAIVGLWVSSTYPSTKSAMVNSDTKVKYAEFGEQNKRLEVLIGVLITSAIVMVCLLVFQASKMIIPNFDFYTENYLMWKCAGVAFLFGLGLCQVVATSYVIAINVTFINDMYKVIHDNDKDNQF